MSQSQDGRFTASGHENGSVYIFNNDTGRLSHSLAGLVHPVRSVAFSPASKLLAAGGDAKIIALYDVNSGEQVANFTGHGGWVLSLDWSDTGEYLLSGYVYSLYLKGVLGRKLIWVDLTTAKQRFGASRRGAASPRIRTVTRRCGVQSGYPRAHGARCLR
jgi:WD40 repeat protein